MQIARIYTPQKLSNGQEIKLDIDASRHLLRVLRGQRGDLVTVFNGEGGEFQGRLVAAQNNHAVIEILYYVDVNRESPLEIHLVQGISRGERMDRVVQKATELGVDSITPIFTERCTVKLSGDRLERRLDHWKTIAIAACEQSGRSHVPQIRLAQNYTDAISKYQGVGYLCDTESNTPFRHYSEKATVITLLIGPEGGFSDLEIQTALKNGFQSFSLGPRILRTETAPIVAITLLQCHGGDL